MEYLKLIAGILFIVAFGWVLLKNKERRGSIHALFGIEIILGLVAGAYLIITSVISLWEKMS